MSNKRVGEIEEMTGIDMNKRPKDMKWAEAEAIVDAFQKMKFMAPPSNGLIPIGSEQIEKGMKQILKPEFVATLTRKPVTYKGGVSFIVEAGIAYGGDAGRIVNEQRKSEIMRFANRVPLTFDQGSCAITEALKSIDWKRYGLKDLDNTPLTLFVNLISTQVPYLSTGKQKTQPICCVILYSFYISYSKGAVTQPMWAFMAAPARSASPLAIAWTTASCCEYMS